jgi:prepilin-type N-terminal cleavage/methylation domain-containing protein
MSHTIMKNRYTGYTLIELMVSIALFAIVMTLVSGAYLIVINLDRQTQSITVGIDNFSFALDAMTRTIRTGTSYNCDSGAQAGDCEGGGTFSVVDSYGDTVSYSISKGALMQTTDYAQTGQIVSTALTDSSSITGLSLSFYTSGAAPSDHAQPTVTILISGNISVGPGKTLPITVETTATMRGINIPT